MGTVCKLIEPSTIYSQKGLVLSRKGTLILNPNTIKLVFVVFPR